MYLKRWRVDGILLQEGLGAHVVHDGGGQVLQDGVHGVPGLLPRHPEVLLQRPGDAAERRMVMRIIIMMTLITLGRWTGLPRKSPVDWWGLEYGYCH